MHAHFLLAPTFEKPTKSAIARKTTKTLATQAILNSVFNFCLVYLHLQKVPVSIVTSRQPIVNDNNNINNNNNNLYVCNIIVVLVNDNCFYHNNLEELLICALLSLEFASSDLH